VLLIPLRKDGTYLGGISALRTEVKPFTEAEISLLESFAAQAVIAMENARLLTELRQRTEELAQRNSEYGERIEHQSATIDVLKAMSSTPDDTQPVFDLITRRAQELCNSPAVGIFEYDGELVHVRSSHFGKAIAGVDKFFSSFPMKPTRGSITSRAILDKETIHILAALAKRRLASAPQTASHSIFPTLPNGSTSMAARTCWHWVSMRCWQCHCYGKI
jgi:hypothetical protein